MIKINGVKYIPIDETYYGGGDSGYKRKSAGEIMYSKGFDNSQIDDFCHGLEVLLEMMNDKNFVEAVKISDVSTKKDINKIYRALKSSYK